MKTEDIKKMAQAWNQVQEASYGKKKEAMDPVDQKELKGKHKDRKDKDIDNDGDVDKSDEYLHKRRKAVSKAIKGKGSETEVQTQESVEELDEISKKTLGSYIKKASDDMHSAGSEFERKSARAMKARGSRTDTLGRDSTISKYEKGASSADKRAAKRQTGIAKATDRLTKEDVEELDEIRKKTLGS